ALQESRAAGEVEAVELLLGHLRLALLGRAGGGEHQRGDGEGGAPHQKRYLSARVRSKLRPPPTLASWLNPEIACAMLVDICKPTAKSCTTSYKMPSMPSTVGNGPLEEIGPKSPSWSCNPSPSPAYGCRDLPTWWRYRAPSTLG